MHIPPELIIHQTRHWTLNQRIDSALPGYCMLGSRQPATAFQQLPEQALAEFGPLLARVEREMNALLRPRRIYVGRARHGSATGDRRIAPGIRLRRPTPNIVWAGLRARAGRMTVRGWMGSKGA